MSTLPPVTHHILFSVSWLSTYSSYNVCVCLDQVTCVGQREKGVINTHFCGHHILWPGFGIKVTVNVLLNLFFISVLWIWRILAYISLSGRSYECESSFHIHWGAPVLIPKHSSSVLYWYTQHLRLQRKQANAHSSLKNTLIHLCMPWQAEPAVLCWFNKFRGMLTTSSGMLHSQAVDSQSCWGIQTQGPTEGEYRDNLHLQQCDGSVLSLERAVLGWGL